MARSRAFAQYSELAPAFSTYRRMGNEDPDTDIMPGTDTMHQA